MTMTAAPYARMRRAASRNASSPSFNESEFTTPLPGSARSPASTTDSRELSTMIGSRATSGSIANSRRNRSMASSESSSASSMFTSRTFAPPSTWSRATRTASSNSPERMSRANRREPVTFVRSPTTRKADSGRTSGSVPASLNRRGRSGIVRGAARPARSRSASTMAAMCSGVVPQHPPTKLTRPPSARSATAAAVSSGVSSYSPSSFGSPAFGTAPTGADASRDRDSRKGRIIAAPSEQLIPAALTPACSTEIQKASASCPVRFRPPRSTAVKDTISPASPGASRIASAAASRAALAFSVSKQVSTSSRSAPPASSPRACSR